MLSYLGFTIKLLWKLAKMFPGQPHTVTVGFVVPSVATFIFVQYYSPERAQASKEVSDVLCISLGPDIHYLPALTDECRPESCCGCDNSSGCLHMYFHCMVDAI